MLVRVCVYSKIDLVDQLPTIPRKQVARPYRAVVSPRSFVQHPSLGAIAEVDWSEGSEAEEADCGRAILRHEPGFLFILPSVGPRLTHVVTVIALRLELGGWRRFPPRCIHRWTPAV
jgi:hypothetical protein